MLVGATLFAFAAAFIHFSLELVLFQTISLFNALQTLIPAGKHIICFFVFHGFDDSLCTTSATCSWFGHAFLDVAACLRSVQDASACKGARRITIFATHAS